VTPAPPACLSRKRVDVRHDDLGIGDNEHCVAIVDTRLRFRSRLCWLTHGQPQDSCFLPTWLPQDGKLLTLTTQDADADADADADSSIAIAYLSGRLVNGDYHP
jgi:hypothetical protein